MTFAHIVGHDAAIARLARAAAQTRVGGGYLLTGPAGIGKRTLARALAARLLCTTPVAGPPEGGDACGGCGSCRRVAAGTHPDLHVVTREEDRRDIRIDQVRELARWLALRPLEARWKVGVLEEADCLNDHGQNALLKTLEEPPGASVLVLTAVHPSHLLPTVRSRCQHLRLDPLPVPAVAAFLVSRGMAADRATALAARAGGIPGRALALADDPHADIRASMVEQLAELAQHDAARCSAVAQRLAKGAIEPALETAFAWYRDLLARVLGEPEDPPRAPAAAERLATIARRTTAERVLRQLETVYAASEAIDRNVNRVLALETMFLALRRLERETVPPAS